MIKSNIIQMRLTRSYGFSGVFKEIADFHIVRVRFRPAFLETHLISLFFSPSSGSMKSWKSSGQLTTMTSPMLADCQHVRLSHIHGHTAPITLWDCHGDSSSTDCGREASSGGVLSPPTHLISKRTLSGSSQDLILTSILSSFSSHMPVSH
ncbi:hypothetical protein F7725_011294 [Dissostichus mawsoni]|uniref:Uncharacterized protein n=1 Tax=Dissostichus mawsoni TaxID=36200 RepID=A0A7J5Z944_DISMA|nr:hypothetical protein F7725_011294 [Dissostichus mawsoni]